MRERWGPLLDNDPFFGPCLDKLCGERTKELKVATPEKYGWNPRDLLQRVCEVTAHFCQEPGFPAMLVGAADDISETEKTNTGGSALTENTELAVIATGP